MEKYGDIKSVKKRIRYLKKLYCQCQNPMDREKVGKSLIANINLLHSRIHLVHFSIENDIERILKECITLVRNVQYQRINRNFSQEELYMDANYLSFLMTLANLVADGELHHPTVSSNDSFDRDEVVNGAKRFYDSLQDEEISPLATKILSDPASLYFFEYRDENNLIESKLFDYVFHKPYVCVLEHHDFRDLFTLIRKCAFGIQFYMEDDFHYNVFQDVCAYVMEELAFTYFEDAGMSCENIAWLKQRRESSFIAFANDTLMQIHSLPGQRNLKSFFHPNMNEILKVIPHQLKKNLIHIQVYVMARVLVQQIQFDQKIGLDHLKKLMHMNIATHQQPDFEKIGLDNDVLIAFAQEMKTRNQKIYLESNGKKR